MAQTSRNNSKKTTVVKQRWERFKKQLVKFKGQLQGSLVIILAFHISKIAIGSIYLDDCPVDKRIPVFLIVAGVVGLVLSILGLFKDFLIKYIKVSYIVNILGIFGVIWFICGCVWIFKVLTPSYDPISGAQYCHKTLYIFSLVSIGLSLAILLLSIVLLLLFALCCCAGLLVIFGPDEGNGDEETARPKLTN